MHLFRGACLRHRKEEKETAHAASTVQLHYDTGGLVFGMAAADLNADGRPDLVTANAFSGSVSVLRSTCLP